MKSARRILLCLSFILIGLLTICFLCPAANPDCGIVANAAYLDEAFDELTLAKGESVTLRLTDTKKQPKWKSEDPSIASVTQKGKVTAKKRGQTYLVTKVNGETYYCHVIVETPKLSKKSLILLKGTSAELELKGNSQSVKWSSSDKSIAKVTSYGWVTAKGAGVATITAKVGKMKYTCKVTVEAPQLSKKKIIIEPGQSYNLKVTGTTLPIKWTSSKENIATVSDNGSVSALKIGVTNIIAKIKGQKYVCKVYVEKPTLSKSSLTLNRFSEYTLKVKGTYQDVTWKSLNPAVATVDSDGEVYAKANGTTTIQAVINNKTLKCSVTVETPKISTDELKMSVGESYTLRVEGTTQPVAWYSSNSNVVTVSSSGVLNAKSAGDALINAIVGDDTLECYVEVAAPKITDNIEDFSIKEAEIYNGNGIIISVVGADNSENAVGVKLMVENNSDLSLSISVHNSAVNGMMYDNNIYDFHLSVPAGKKGIDTFEIKKEWFESVGIQKISCFDFLFWAYDNAKSYKEFESDIVRVKTNNYSGNQILPAGTSVYNQEGMRISFLGLDGNRLKYCVENTGSTYFNYDVSDVSVNTWAMDTTYDFDIHDLAVFPGNASIFELEIKQDFLEETKISKISNVEFILEYRLEGSYFNSKQTDIIHTTIL